MTAVPDPAELAPSRDPAAYGRRPLLGATFWALMAFAAVCLAAALAVVLVTSRRGTPAPVRPAVAGAPPAAVAPFAAPAFAGPPLALAPGQAQTLGDKIAHLEADETRVLRAAGLTLAAAAIGDAAGQPRSFAATLQAYARYLPPAADAGRLSELAARGAPTRQALAASLAQRAAQASVAAREPSRTAGFMAQLSYALSRVVSVRRLDTRGSGPDALLAKAQARADEGDLEGAVALLGALPTPARDRLSDWLDGAGRRIEIDRRVGSLREAALAELAQAEAPAP